MLEVRCEQVHLKVACISHIPRAMLATGQRRLRNSSCTNRNRIARRNLVAVAERVRMCEHKAQLRAERCVPGGGGASLLSKEESPSTKRNDPSRAVRRGGRRSRGSACSKGSVTPSVCSRRLPRHRRAWWPTGMPLSLGTLGTSRGRLFLSGDASLQFSRLSATTEETAPEPKKRLTQDTNPPKYHDHCVRIQRL